MSATSKHEMPCCSRKSRHNRKSHLTGSLSPTPLRTRDDNVLSGAGSAKITGYNEARDVFSSDTDRSEPDIAIRDELTRHERPSSLIPKNRRSLPRWITESDTVSRLQRSSNSFESRSFRWIAAVVVDAGLR